MSKHKKWIKRGIGAGIAIAGAVTGQPQLIASGVSTAVGPSGDGGGRASKGGKTASIAGQGVPASAQEPPIFYPSADPRANVRSSRKERSRW